MADYYGEIISPRVTALEETYVKSLWFEQINSGTSGSVTLPTGGSIILDQWAAGVDALASTIAGGIPTYESPKTAGGDTITATMDASGAYSLSDTPSSYPVAIIYCYKVTLSDLDESKVMGGLSVIADVTTTGLPAGSVTGDVLRYNAVAGDWEVKQEPLAFKGLVLTPALTALVEAEGAIFYSSSEKAVMICTDI